MDSLRPSLAGATVLDLFAGQGRFSFASLEHGAVKAVMVEKNRDTARNLPSLRPKKLSPHLETHILCQDVWQFLKNPDGVLYDIIFADPPFPDWTSELEKNLFAALPAFCHPGTILLVKIPSAVLLSSHHPGFTLWKINHFGESQLAYFTYGKSENPS